MKRPTQLSSKLILAATKHLRLALNFPGVRNRDILKFQGRQYPLFLTEAGEIFVYTKRGEKIASGFFGREE